MNSNWEISCHAKENTIDITWYFDDIKDKHNITYSRNKLWFQDLYKQFTFTKTKSVSNLDKCGEAYLLVTHFTRDKWFRNYNIEENEEFYHVAQAMRDRSLGIGK